MGSMMGMVNGGPSMAGLNFSQLSPNAQGYIDHLSSQQNTPQVFNPFIHAFLPTILALNPVSNQQSFLTAANQYASSKAGTPTASAAPASQGGQSVAPVAAPAAAAAAAAAPGPVGTLGLANARKSALQPMASPLQTLLGIPFESLGG